MFDDGNWARCRSSGISAGRRKTMDAKDLGRRLRSARESRGLSQQAVAQALGLPRTALTQLESGSRTVSTLELTRMSELYLHPVADLLHEGPRDEDRDVLVALHRVAQDWRRIQPRASRSPGVSTFAGRASRSNVCWAPNPGLARPATKCAFLARPERP